jgi:hypothetical protein
MISVAPIINKSKLNWTDGEDSDISKSNPGETTWGNIGIFITLRLFKSKSVDTSTNRSFLRKETENCHKCEPIWSKYL